jgi:hypothetical protein
LALLILPSCGDDTTGPSEGEFTITFEALPSLGHGRYYEAWLSVPADHARHENVVSLGKFTMSGDGTASSLEGGPASFGTDDVDHLDDAVNVLITVESEGATEPGPVLLAGAVTGDEHAAHATLTTSHELAVGADLAAATGSFVLATPSDGEGANETQGLWFTDPSGLPTLGLPALSAHWRYHAHVFHGGHSLSLGTFVVADEADSDGAGAEAGVEAAFTAPGSDFLVSGHDFADGATTAFIVIEPAEDHHGEARDARRHDSSFPVRVLQATISKDAAARSSIALSRDSLTLPSVTVEFTR